MYILGICVVSFSFVYGQPLQPQDRMLGTQQTKGYTVEIPQAYRALRRSWWQFLSTLAKVSLQKGHWQLHFKEGFTLYTVIAPSETSEASHIYVGLPTNVPKEDSQKYASELRQLLQSFAISMQKTQLEERLKACEKIHTQKSLRLEKLLQKQRKVSNSSPHHTLDAAIRNLQAEIESLKHQQASIIKQLSTLGD